MFVDLDERARTVVRLGHAVALRPVLHQSPTVRVRSLPAGLAASAAAPAPAIAAVAAAAAESAFRLGPRLVDRQRASAHLILVELGRGLLRLFVGRHLDERKAA